MCILIFIFIHLNNYYSVNLSSPKFMRQDHCEIIEFHKKNVKIN